MSVEQVQSEYDAIQAEIALLIVKREKIYIRLVEEIEKEKGWTVETLE